MSSPHRKGQRIPASDAFCLLATLDAFLTGALAKPLPRPTPPCLYDIAISALESASLPSSSSPSIAQYSPTTVAGLTLDLEIPSCLSVWVSESCCHPGPKDRHSAASSAHPRPFHRDGLPPASWTATSGRRRPLRPMTGLLVVLISLTPWPSPQNKPS